jgi:hypothetical protein
MADKDEKRFHDIDLVANGPLGHNTDLFIDGKLIRGVRRIDLRVEANDVNVITIELIAGSLNGVQR